MDTYNTPKGVDQYIKMCQGYDNSSFKSSIIKNLGRGSNILELGMGPGNDYIWLSENYNVTGTDYSEEFIKRAKIRFPQGDFLEIDAITIKCQKKFSAIYSCKVLHHFELDQLKKSLIRQHEVLKPDGLIIHSFWIGDKTEDFDDMHCVYFPTQKLIDLISKNYEVIEYSEYEELEPNDSLFVIAKKLN
ncbi:MAG: class I SAM-dependent methyltransferase [Spirochaetaceae bacterium]